MQLLCGHALYHTPNFTTITEEDESAESFAWLLHDGSGRYQGALHQDSDGSSYIPRLRSPLSLHLRRHEEDHGATEASRHPHPPPVQVCNICHCSPRYP